jgi:hypothetical protein
MHLLALLMDQLSSSVATLRLVDFVDISHLLLNTCMSDSPQLTTLTEDTLYNRGELSQQYSVRSLLILHAQF